MARAASHVKSPTRRERRQKLVRMQRREGEVETEKIRTGAAREGVRRSPSHPPDGPVARGSEEGRRGQARRGAALFRRGTSYEVVLPNAHHGRLEEDISSAWLNWRPLRRELLGVLDDTLDEDRKSLRGRSLLPGEPPTPQVALRRRSRFLQEPSEGGGEGRNGAGCCWLGLLLLGTRCVGADKPHGCFKVWRLPAFRRIVIRAGIASEHALIVSGKFDASSTAWRLLAAESSSGRLTVPSISELCRVAGLGERQRERRREAGRQGGRRVGLKVARDERSRAHVLGSEPAERSSVLWSSQILEGGHVLSQPKRFVRYTPIFSQQKLLS